MNENFQSDPIQDAFYIRPLTHEDYSDICEICRDIWDGTDYLPEVFHSWVDDNGGFFGLVEKATNKVVGADKFSVLFDGTGWFEGLRVHPAYRGKGLSTMMTDHVMQVGLKELGAGRVVRLAFSTHITSKQSIGLMTARNFVLQQKYALAVRNYETYEADPKYQVAEPWEPSYEEIRDSDYLKRLEGILPLAFYFQEFTKAYYDYLKEAGAFLTIGGHHGIQYFKGGECYYLVPDNTAEGFQAFSDWAWFAYKDKMKGFPLGTVFPEDIALKEKLKTRGFENWMDWEPDYLYFLYKA